MAIVSEPNEHPMQQPMMGTLGDQLHRVLTLIKRSFRHFWKAVIIGVVGLGISLTVAVVKKRRYMSEAVILYRPAIDPSAVSNVNTGQRPDTKEIGARLDELLKARPRLKKVIDKHKLFQQLIERRGYVEAVDEMRRKIIFRVGQGDTFHISFLGQTPEMAQKVTAELANSLIEQNTTLRQEQAEATVSFLVSETQRLQKALSRKQSAVARFLSDNPEFALEDQPNAPGASIRAMRERMKQAAKGGDALTVLQRQATRLRAQIKNPGAVVTGPADPRLVSAQERAEEDVRESRNQLQQAKAKFTARHPDVIAATKRYDASNAALRRVKDAIKASRRLRSTRKVGAAAKEQLKQRLASIEAQIASMKRARKAGASAAKEKPTAERASNRIVALETRWQTVNREVRQSRDAYVKLEERLFKARLSASSESASQGAQLRIIDPAYEPTKPSGTGRTVIVGGGLVVSALIGGLLMLGLALIDHRIYDRFDVERLSLGGVLVEVPRKAGKKVKLGKTRIKPGDTITT